jgi:hypothetical protein
VPLPRFPSPPPLSTRMDVETVHAPRTRHRSAEQRGVEERGGGRGQNLGEFEAELLCGFGVGADGAGIPDAVICDFFFEKSAPRFLFYFKPLQSILFENGLFTV